jgi:acid phosphatase family membrane protein YuiD
MHGSDGSFWTLFKSPCFWAALCAWLVAQFTKMLVAFHKTRRLDFHYLVSTGGMPSAHSSLVAGLATSVGMTVGFGTPLFITALAFAIIVMFDASTVRRAADQQARLLNEMVDELFKEHRFSENKLRELLGHTRLEVFMGMLIGVLVAIVTVGVWSRF